LHVGEKVRPRFKLSRRFLDIATIKGKLDVGAKTASKWEGSRRRKETRHEEREKEKDRERETLRRGMLEGLLETLP